MPWIHHNYWQLNSITLLIIVLYFRVYPNIILERWEIWTQTLSYKINILSTKPNSLVQILVWFKKINK